jgi:F0F1-type ATP synthase delta subunit
LHKEAIQPNVFCNPAEGRHQINNQIYDTLHEVNRLCSTDADLKTILDKFPTRTRLSVFQTICCTA